MSDAAVKPISFSFDPTAKGRYHLSIGLDEHSRTFAVLDIPAKSYVALFEQDRSTPALSLFGKELKALEPVSVSAFVKGGVATLVPSGSFQEAHAAAHLALTHSEVPNSEVLHEAIPALPVQLLYCRENADIDALQERFPAMKTVDARTVFLNGAARRSAADAIEMHLQVWEQSIDLALFENGALKLFNSHFFNSPEDVLYHCVFALDRAKLDRNKVRMRLSGKVEQNGPLQQLMEQYFSAPVLAEAPDLLTLSPELQAKDPHAHHLLYELFQCV